MLDEVAQQPELERRQLDRLAIAHDLGAAKIDPDRPKLKGLRSRSWRGLRRAAQQRLQAREQLDHLKWLGQVVVGAELQPDDLVDHLAAGCEHNDRGVDITLS